MSEPLAASERCIPEEIRVGSTVFRKGVKLSTVLGRIERGFAQPPVHIEPIYCKDCAFYKSSWLGARYSRCKNPAVNAKNLVQPGEDLEFCNMARRDGGPCGSLAVHFRSKNAPAVPRLKDDPGVAHTEGFCEGWDMAATKLREVGFTEAADWVAGMRDRLAGRTS